MTRSVADRLWEKAEYTMGCWTWTGSRSGTKERPYGNIGIGSRTDGTRRSVPAHRVAYEIMVGPIPEGHDLHHKCGNSLCIRPSHLEPVSRREHVYRHDGPTAENGRLTHCRKCGRALSGRNLIVEGKAGARRCRHCRNEYMREFKRAARTLARSKKSSQS